MKDKIKNYWKDFKERYFKKPTKENVKTFLLHNLMVVIGTFLLTVGVELFIVPVGLDTGGLSGLSIAMKAAGVQIDINNLITILTWSFFALGLICLGVDFSLKTLVSTIAYTGFLYLLAFLAQKMPWLYLQNAPSLKDNQALVVLLSAVFGGVFVGAGCAVTYMVGGSTGGIDILTFVICKYFKSVKASYSLFFFDASIVLLGFIFVKDLGLCLEGVLSAFITAIVIDKILVGGSQTFVAYIFTDKIEEITKEVIEKMNRTTSIIDVQGGYSKEKKKMIMLSFSIRDYASVRSTVARIDKKAFVTICRCNEINGEGFKPIE